MVKEKAGTVTFDVLKQVLRRPNQGWHRHMRLLVPNHQLQRTRSGGLRPPTRAAELRRSAPCAPSASWPCVCSRQVASRACWRCSSNQWSEEVAGQVTNSSEEIMFGTFGMQLVFVLTLFLLPTISDAQGRDNVSIIVTIGQRCACGNHTGSCDAEYMQNKIEVTWRYPTRILKGKKSAEDWYSVVCPTSGSQGVSSLSGAKVKIVGYWMGTKSFEAHEVILGD